MTHRTLSPEALEKANRLSRNIELAVLLPFCVLVAAAPLIGAAIQIGWKGFPAGLPSAGAFTAMVAFIWPAAWLTVRRVTVHALELGTRGAEHAQATTTDPFKGLSPTTRGIIYGAAAAGWTVYMLVWMLSSVTFLLGFRGLRAAEPLLLLAAEPVGLICGIREALRWAKQSNSSKGILTVRGE